MILRFKLTITATRDVIYERQPCYALLRERTGLDCCAPLQQYSHQHQARLPRSVFHLSSTAWMQLQFKSDKYISQTLRKEQEIWKGMRTLYTLHTTFFEGLFRLPYCCLQSLVVVLWNHRASVGYFSYRSTKQKKEFWRAILPKQYFRRYIARSENWTIALS